MKRSDTATYALDLIHSIWVATISGLRQPRFVRKRTCQGVAVRKQLTNAEAILKDCHLAPVE